MEGKDKLPPTTHHPWAGVEPWPGEAPTMTTLWELRVPTPTGLDT